MKYVTRGILAAGVAWLATLPALPRTDPFVLGADVSGLQENEDSGQKFFDQGMQKGLLQILKERKFNFIRLRIFNNPKAQNGGSAATTGAVYSGYSGKGYCGLDSTLLMARRIKEAGLGFGLDFHYSDNWADPGKQYKPHAWANATFSQLTDSVRSYTRNVLTALKNQGTLPQTVQVGNEITNGMIWPEGRTSDWTRLSALLKAGIAGVKDVDPGIKTVMHIANGNDNAFSQRWIDSAVAHGVDFDIFGESCYVRWHAPVSSWGPNFTSLAARYPKYKFLVAEYSGEIRTANDAVYQLPDERGFGTLNWEPQSTYEQSLFSRSGNALTAIDSLMGIYARMSKDYGNDALGTGINDAAPAGRPAQRALLNPEAWLRGREPARFNFVPAGEVEFVLHDMDGKVLGRMRAKPDDRPTPVDPGLAAGMSRSGVYVLEILENSKPIARVKTGRMD